MVDVPAIISEETGKRLAGGRHTCDSLIFFLVSQGCDVHAVKRPFMNPLRFSEKLARSGECIVGCAETAGVEYQLKNSKRTKATISRYVFGG
jgi:hypothetical protein